MNHGVVIVKRKRVPFLKRSVVSLDWAS